MTLLLIKTRYRSVDGRCNWLKKDESYLGSTGQPRSRDWGQTNYADGISKPREGPNPRELSNAFFQRKKRIAYEHTPLMLGLIEFIMFANSFLPPTKRLAHVARTGTTSHTPQTQTPRKLRFLF